MATDVVMPQMGESIAEGTIVRWIKKVGDKIDRDEPLFEISTDKVDAEIPSPAAGVISEIRVKEGETVPINSIVAVIGSAADAAAKPSAPAPPSPPPAHYHDRDEPAAAPAPVSAAAPAPARPAPAPAPAAPARSSGRMRRPPKKRFANARRRWCGRLRKRIRSTSLRFTAPASPDGSRRKTFSGSSTRVLTARRGRSARWAVGQAGQASQGSAAHTAPPIKPGVGDRVEKMTVMRKRIAEHMVLSRKTSAHVHSVFEVNFSRIDGIRKARKAEFEQAGAKLTYMSFIIKAVVDALRHVPIVNASVDGDSVIYHGDINVGVAVALDWGLIVPVIKKADEKNLVGLSRAVVDLAGRARAKQLKPEEVSGGTFTITNPGVFGALFGMPIINQPQVAILGVGNVEKRAVVIDDAIAIRHMAYLTLGYDHRVIDGAVADEFMSMVKRSLEQWDPNVV